MKRIFSPRKITAASVLMASLTSGHALASDKTFVYRMSVDGQVKVPEWVTINYIYGEWSNVGAPHSCQEWVAPPETVDWGESFQQSRLCKQTQNRPETPVLFNPVLKTTKEGATVTGERDVSTTEFRPNIGTRDYIDGERAGAYGSWTRNSANYGCGEWSPKPDEINLFQTFTQSRTCSKDEIRTRDVFHVWASGKETFKRNDSETRTVSEVEQQQSTGSKDYISGVRVDSWSAWAEEGSPYDCASWSPAPSTINLNQDFQQSRSCSQKQISDRDIFDVWRSGKETLNRNEPRSRVISVTQTQDNVGTKDFIKSTRNAEWSSWENSASPYNCSEWTPAPESVKLDEGFTQTRSCSQKQVRDRDVMNVWESGKETLKTVEGDSQVISVEQSRASTGTLDYIVSQTTPSWPAWANDGTPYDCKTWSPSTDTVNLDESFTQSRECSQNQTRSRTIQDVWKSGKKTFNRTDTDDQTITVTQNQSAKGTKNYIVTEKALSWNAWSNVAAPYDCSSWTPTPDTVNLDQSYEQTRTCKQNQSRARTVNDVWADGSETKQRVDTDQQTVTVTQTQAATGSKDYIVSTRTGSYDAWANNGAPYSCAAWSPKPETVNLNTTFTQTRVCSQSQERERTVYNVWKSGKETVLRTEDDARVINVTQNQQATGSKDYIKATETRSWSAWSNDGSPYACSTWSPATGTVNLGSSFTQARDCSQDQKRSRDIYNVWESGKKTYKSTETDGQTITVGQTQSATGSKNFKTGEVAYGSWSAWSNDGSAHTCGAWGPGTDTVNLGASFTQTRACKQDQTRTRPTYDVWADGTKTAKGTQTGTQTVDTTQSRAATGTKDYITTTRTGDWSAWSNSGAVYSCTSWTPTEGTVNLGDSFTQSRSCKQNQTHSRTIYNVWKSGKETVNKTESGNKTIDVPQTRSATGTKDYITGTSAGAWGAWSNSGSPTSCSSWSPATGTVNLGSSFTQSRTCDQAQSRTRTIYNVWKSGKKTVKTSETGSQTIDVTQTQSATGSKNYKTGETSYGSWSAWSNEGSAHTCGAWGPGTDTVNLGASFTQTRACKQDQTRTRTTYDVWADGTKTAKGTQAGSQTVNTTQSRSSTGTKDYITGTNTKAWGAWSNSGSAYDCGTWSPAVNTVNLGESFTQSRSCSQKQIRTRDIYNVWKSGKQTLKETGSESQIISVTKNQSATGTKNYKTGSVSYSSWSGWSNSGSLYECGTWSPATGTVNLGDSFTQNRDCKQNQTRNRTVYDVWADGSKTAKSTQTGSQTITVGQTQSATGTKDYITGTSYGSWSAWSNSATANNCSAWSPSPSTVNLGSSFTQTRTCDQAQKRTRTVYNVWKSGKKTIKTTQTGTQTIDVTQSQTATGTKNFKTGETAYGSWSSWSNSGTVHTCGSWGPDTGTVNLGTTFTQERTCKQDQTRTRATYDVWADGSKTSKGTQTGNRTIDSTQSRSNTGTKDYITGTSNGSWSAWSNSGSVHTCGAWGPDTGTVNLGSSFTQTRSCKQNQTHTRTVYNVWKSGKKTTKTTQTGSQTIDVTQSRSATGTKNYKTGTLSYSSWSGWSNNGSAYDCGAWSPAENTVNLGSSYTQSRSCSQNQRRTRTVYDVWADGSKTAKTTQTGTQTISVTQSQSATGTKDYITGTSAGSWGSWSNSGNPTGCDTWSPAESTVNLGGSFTQTRTCDQAQTRTRTIYNVWKSGKKTSKSTQTGSQTIDVTQSRSATGTKDYITGTTYGGWSGWSNNGSVKNCTSWSPSTGTVNLGTSFTQTRTCDQDQKRTRTLYNVWKSGKKTAKSTQTGTQTIEVTQNNTATGTKNFKTGSKSYGAWSSWSNDGGRHTCEAWSPSPSTVNLGKSFTQTRDCKQDQKRTRTVYDVWADGSKTVNSTQTGTQTITVGQSQSATGTKDYITTTTYGSWSGWSNSGSVYSCSGYSPSTGTVNLGSTFTQSRSCSQNQTRTRTLYNVWKSGKKTAKSTQNGSQTITVTQSRSATGSKDYITGTTTGSWGSWSNTGGLYSCETWSPSTSTVNLDSSFTQQRYCLQKQVRYRTIYNVWKSGKTTTKSTESSNQAVNVRQTQSAVGTKNYITGTSYGSWSGWSNSGGVYSCSGYSPSTGSVNLGSTFTQSRSCSQNQVRSRTVYNVWKDGSKTYKTTQSGTQAITVTQSRSATGTKDYITGTSAGSWSSWSNVGGVYGCGYWSPSASTVDYGKSFTQTRDCTQRQEANRTIYNVWKSGSKTYKSTEDKARGVTVSRSQTATGTKNVVVGSESTTGAWSYTASASCGGWSPYTSTVNYGKSFTQTQSCSRPRKRTITTYNVWTNGSKTVKSTTTQTGTYNYSNSRSATGTKDYVTSSGWNTSYSYTYSSWSCGSYSPSPRSMPDGTSFTQSRTCTRTKYRNKRYYNNWRVKGRVYSGSTSVYSSSTESKTETRTAWGAGLNCPTYDPRTGTWRYCP